MLLPKKALVVHKAASADGAKFALNGVFIEPSGKTSATDGHILVSFTPPVLDNPKDRPRSIEGVNLVDPVDVPLEPFILSTSDAQMITKTIPKSHQHVMIDLQQTNNSDYAVLLVASFPQQTFKCKKIKDTFPDFTRVTSTGEPCFKIALGLSALRKLVTTLAALEVEACKFSFYSADKPVKVESTDGYRDGKVEALIMPCRLCSN